MEKQEKFTVDDVVMWTYPAERLVDILNGEYDLDEARDDLRGLIGSKHDSRSNSNIK